MLFDILLEFNPKVIGHFLLSYQVALGEPEILGQFLQIQ